MKKTLLLLIFLFIQLKSNSQSKYNDYFVYKNGDSIQCKITKVKNQNIYFEVKPDIVFEIKKDLTRDIKSRKSTNPSSKSSTYKPNHLNFYSCKDIFISKKTILELNLNIIKKPEEGYAHVYFYMPKGFSSKSFIIQENGKKIFKLKPNSFFLKKIKQNEIHTYVTKTLLNKEEVTVKAKNKNIYFINAFIVNCNSGGGMMGMPMAGGMTIMMGIGGSTGSSKGSCGRNLKLDENRFAELQVMSMYKKPIVY